MLFVLTQLSSRIWNVRRANRASLRFGNTS
jgi:hypothetical protein